MIESTGIDRSVKRHYSPRAVLAAIGAEVRAREVFEPIRERVDIGQKTVKYTPTEKLEDVYIGILAGSHGLVEINKRVRPDPGLQAAFGRKGCAEQSVVQDTLDACTDENVKQIEQAMDDIYRQHSRGYQHDYRTMWQLLDVDITGRPCGKKAAFATKGYFAHQRNRRGRQVGYVVATHYEEIVIERVLSGRMQLSLAFQPLVEAAEGALELDESKRRRTILRVDSGGGSVEDVNWALARGYHFHGKDYSGNRVRNIVPSIAEWVTDPKEPGRQVGWVTEPTDLYARPLRRIAVRCRKKNGHWAYGIILSSLSPVDVLTLIGMPPQVAQASQTVLFAYVYFYDKRGGGVETEIKEDKQGLGTRGRNKKRFPAQQVLGQLEALAHNTLVWVRRWLAPHCPKVTRWGMLRLVRDVCHMSGQIVVDEANQVRHILLNQAEPLAKQLAAALAIILAPEHIVVTSGET